jgi:(p)ppGpp synthase/HD superfamily hydrolase
VNLADALALACKVHRDQVDLCGEPYILHVMRVVTSLEFSAHHDEEFKQRARVAAALHDVVEDGVTDSRWT